MNSNKIDPKRIAQAVAPFEKTEPWQGIAKFISLSIPLIAAGFWLIFKSPSLGSLVLLSAVYGFVYACLLITTHDAIHHTFTGNKIADEVLPRLVSWPVYWVHSIYSEVHKLHHNMNGTNLNDPERVQFTVSEYQSANPLIKFFIRQQWFFNLFVFSGIGLIWKTIRYGSRFIDNSKSMRRAFVIDAIGISFCNATIITFVLMVERLEYYIIWYAITQYCVGLVLQLRAHVEHYGLWGKGDNFYDTQVWNCRNMSVPWIVSWYFNFLSYHTIHHAFPKVPFYKLKKAQEAMKKIYQESGRDIPESNLGYIRQALTLAVNPRLIDDRDANKSANALLQFASGTSTITLHELLNQK